MRSDVERKRLFGVDPLNALPTEAYSADVTSRVYDRLHSEAREALEAGYCVVFNATHLNYDERVASERVATAASCTFHGIWLEGGLQTLSKRVRGRINDASDADEIVLRGMATLDTGTVSWDCIACDGSVCKAVHMIERHLFNNQT